MNFQVLERAKKLLQRPFFKFLLLFRNHDTTSFKNTPKIISLYRHLERAKNFCDGSSFSPTLFKINFNFFQDALCLFRYIPCNRKITIFLFPGLNFVALVCDCQRRKVYLSDPSERDIAGISFNMSLFSNESISSFCGPSSTLYYNATQDFSKAFYIFACGINTIISISSTLGNELVLSKMRISAFTVESSSFQFGNDRSICWHCSSSPLHSLLLDSYFGNVKLLLCDSCVLCDDIMVYFLFIIPLLRHFTIFGQENAQNMRR